MRKSFAPAMLLALAAAPVLAAQPADGTYACTRGDVALGDIEIAGLTYRDRASGAEFGEPAEYIMLDDTSIYWLADPAILTAGGYRVDNTKTDGTRFVVTVLADGASEFEVVACAKP